MIRKIAEKNNKKAENPIFWDKKAEKNAENTQIFDANTRASEIRIHCLVNRSRVLHSPKDKKHLNNRYYAQHNYTAEQIPLNSVCEDTLLKGYHFVPGEFRPHTDGIRKAENWQSQQLFLIEFDDTTENTLQDFIQARPFIQQNAWLVTESLRSQYDDPGDPDCNGQIRVRIVFCMPEYVNTRDEHQWIYDALENALPGCDKGSANSITNGGLGRAGAEYVKIGNLVDTDWFNRAIKDGKAAEQQKQAERKRVEQERKRKQAERASMGFTEREGELPIEALAKTDPSLFLESMGLSVKYESGQYQHWGRIEKQGDTALSVWQSDRGNWQIRVFANSIPTPPSLSGAMPFARFYCYHELHTDIEDWQPDSHQWKDINAQLAHRGYGTWLSDEEFHAQNTSNIKHTYTAPVRLSVSEYERETEQIEKQQEKISAKLREWEANTRGSGKQHLLNITTAAGTRKTTVTVHHFDTLLYIAKTKEEADQAFSIADSLERDAWRHRPRMYNRDQENWDILPLGLGTSERPCIHPETCNMLAQRGNPPVPSFCKERCEVYEICRAHGFLSQIETERKKESVFLAWDEAFFSDAQFLSQVEYILNKEKMLVLDEADPAGLPQHRQISEDELRQIIEGWRLLPDERAINICLFLKNLLEKLSTAAEPEQIRDAIKASVKHLTDDDVSNFDNMLSKIPLGVIWDKSDEGLEAVLIYGDAERRVFVTDERQPPEGFDGTIPTYFAEHGVEINTLQLITVSLDVFDRAGFINITQDPEKAPRRFTSLVKNLKTFAASESTACHRTKSTLDFFLPPGLNAPRGITLTASDKDDLIREVYRDTRIEVETFTGIPPPFMPGCKYFQIATGRYTTKRGLLELGKEKGKYIGVSSIFKRMLDVILKIADRYDVLVVASKDALNAKIDSRIAKLHNHLNVECINHHHAEGRNDFQHCDVVFVFNFEPRPDEIEKIARRIYREDTLNFDREKTDVEVDGVKLASVMRYKDERVQKVYDRECESRHMQALMRLRPMINPNKMIVSFSAEPVSRIPIPPVPFILPELETFILKDNGDLATFDAYLESKAKRSVKEVTEQDGVSESTAYRRTKKQRVDAKTEMKAKAVEMKNSGYSITEIANHFGKNKGTVSRWLK